MQPPSRTACRPSSTRAWCDRRRARSQPRFAMLETIREFGSGAACRERRGRGDSRPARDVFCRVCGDDRGPSRRHPADRARNPRPPGAWSTRTCGRHYRGCASAAIFRGCWSSAAPSSGSGYDAAAASRAGVAGRGAWRKTPGLRMRRAPPCSSPYAGFHPEYLRGAGPVRGILCAISGNALTSPRSPSPPSGAQTSRAAWVTWTGPIDTIAEALTALNIAGNTVGGARGQPCALGSQRTGQRPWGFVRKRNGILLALIARQRAIGNASGREESYACWPLMTLGAIEHCEGSPAVALEHYQASLDHAWRFGVSACSICAVARIAGMLAGVGRWQEAAWLFGAAESYNDKTGYAFRRHLGLDPSLRPAATLARREDFRGRQR